MSDRKDCTGSLYGGYTLHVRDLYYRPCQDSMKCRATRVFSSITNRIELSQTAGAHARYEMIKNSYENISTTMASVLYTERVADAE